MKAWRWFFFLVLEASGRGQWTRYCLSLSFSQCVQLLLEFQQKWARGGGNSQHGDTWRMAPACKLSVLCQWGISSGADGWRHDCARDGVRSSTIHADTQRSGVSLSPWLFSSFSWSVRHSVVCPCMEGQASRWASSSRVLLACRGGHSSQIACRAPLVLLRHHRHDAEAPVASPSTPRNRAPRAISHTCRTHELW